MHNFVVFYVRSRLILAQSLGQLIHFSMYKKEIEIKRKRDHSLVIWHTFTLFVVVWEEACCLVSSLVSNEICQRTHF